MVIIKYIVCSSVQKNTENLDGFFIFKFKPRKKSFKIKI